MVQVRIQGVLAACALLLAAPARAGVDVTPSLKIFAEERYDDDLLPRADPDERGSGQLMTKLTPQLQLEVKDPTLTSTAWYATDFVIRHGSGDASLDHRGALLVRKAIGRRLSLDADMRVWRVADPTSLPRLGMARALSPILYGRAELAGQYLVSQRWIGRVGYRFEGARIYEAQAYGGVVHEPYAEALYQLSRRAELGVRLRYQSFIFGAESADARAALVGFRYRLTPLTALVLRGGPTVYRAAGGTAGLMPTVSIELQREQPGSELAVAIGHDLVGASGFTSALWADYASVIGSLRLAPRLQAFGGASYYRNGAPPDVGFDPFSPGHAATGYALGAGLEWRVSRAVALQGTFDRIAQIAGPGGAAEPGLTRNIIAVRLSITAL